MPNALMNKITLETLTAAYEKHNFTFSKDNINIFGVRAKDMLANSFNDVIGVVYWDKDASQFVLAKYEATTDAGLAHRLNPINPKGCAILQPGQHKDAWKIGKHQGKYTALTQIKPLPLYRDNNKDDRLDPEGEIHYDLAGINIHHASYTGKSVQVDKWSAGCQVIADINDWNNFIELAQRFEGPYTYTLFTENDF